MARTELGWEPTTSLEDGLALTAAYLAEDVGHHRPHDVRLILAAAGSGPVSIPCTGQAAAPACNGR